MTLVRVDDAPSFLASLERAKALLAACSSLDEAKGVRDKAQAVMMWARAQKDAGELEVAAGELRVRATVRMGELLPPKPTPEESGARGGRGNEKAFPSETPFTRKEAHVARAVAAVPVEIRERVVSEAKARGEAPTVAAVLRAGKEEARREVAAERRAPAAESPLTTGDLSSLAASGRKFATIYADPPWSYDNKGSRGTTENHYQTMDLADIFALPVEALAAENAHLHLWATGPLLPEAFAVMESWGFDYKASLVWHKTGRLGLGHYWRVCHEILLLGVRGSLPFPEGAHDIRSVVEHDPSAHSAKPDVFRSLVERVSPGPRLELFGRDSGASAPGWVVWGNQIPRTLFARQLEATS